MILPNYCLLAEMGESPLILRALIEAARNNVDEDERADNPVRYLFKSAGLLLDADADHIIGCPPPITQLFMECGNQHPDLDADTVLDEESAVPGEEQPDLSRVLFDYSIPVVRLLDPEDDEFDPEIDVALTSCILCQVGGSPCVGDIIYLGDLSCVDGEGIPAGACEMVVIEVGGEGMTPRQVQYIDLIPAACVVNDVS